MDYGYLVGRLEEQRRLEVDSDQIPKGVLEENYVFVQEKRLGEEAIDFVRFGQGDFSLGRQNCLKSIISLQRVDFR